MPDTPAPEQAARFLAAALANPVTARILDRLPELGLPDAWLVAGCLFQAVWNRLSGRPAQAGIRDYDIFYFDDRDLSWEAEDRAVRRAAALFADLGAAIDVKNQARVHLWYGARFGVDDYPQLRSSRDGIDRFLVRCTCLGHDGTELYAPYGLDEVFDGVLRANPVNLRPAQFAAKAQSYRARWPWLTIENA